MSTSVAYIYKWTHIPSLRWYVGSRTAKGCHPNDGYVCSSKYVEPLIKSHPEDWTREVITTGNPKEILELEEEILKVLDAKNDVRSFNLHNGDGKFTTLGKKEPAHMLEKRRAALIGKKKPDWFGEMVRKTHTGAKRSAETCKRIGIASKGRKQSAEARFKNSLKNSGTNNASWAGYYVSPAGVKYGTAQQAALAYNTYRQKIVKLAKGKIDGWSFIPKELV